MNIDLYKFRYFEPTSEASGTTISETDGDSLAEAAYAEMDGREVPKKKEPPQGDVEPVIEQPAQPEGEPQKKETDAATQEKEGQEATVEGQAEGDKSTAKAEDKPAEQGALEPIAEEKIQAFAEKNKLTFAQAREELEESQRLLAKYGNDPLELARASRNTQREYDRLKSEQQKPADVATELLSDDQLRAEVKSHAEKNAKLIVEKYREQFPKRTESMDDESILEWAQDDAIKNYKASAGTIIEKNKKDALERRSTLLATIPAKDSKFMHDVKLILDNTPDRMILNPKYNVKSMLELCKGQRYDADMESAYQRGLKAGKESPKILGTESGSGGAAPRVSVAAGKVTLTQEQKNVAYDQFPDSAPSSAEALWADLYKDDLKKNPKFLPN